MNVATIGLVGYGYWGRRLSRHLDGSRHFRLSQIYSPSLARKAGGKHIGENGPMAAKSLEDMETDPDISSVIVAAPIEAHYDVTARLLRAGKNVLVEKPLTGRAGPSRDLADLAVATGCILHVDYTYTFSPAIRRAKELIDRGDIGDLRSVTITLRQLGRFLPSSVYLLLGSHALSILNMFVPLSDLRCDFRNMVRTGKQVTAGMILAESGPREVQGLIELSLHSPEKRKEVLLTGTKGALRYSQTDSRSLVLSSFLSSGDPELPDEKSFIFDEGHTLDHMFEHFHQVIQGEQGSNIRDAVAIDEILEHSR